MIPAISQVCSLPSPFEDEIKDFAASECRAVELWLTKLEQYVSANSVDAVRRLLDEHGVSASVASFQGGLLTSQGEQRREAWQLLDRRLELCRQLGVETLVVACDIASPLSQQDIERAQASLLDLARRVGIRGVRAALELQSKAALGNNLQTTAALVEEVGSPHLGLCLDVFHFHVGPSKLHDLHYLTRENLFHVQLCDVADKPRELASDSDRILPGEGDIDLLSILRRLQEIDYQGYLSVELMNPQIWNVPPRQLGEAAMSALQRLLSAIKEC